MEEPKKLIGGSASRTFVPGWPAHAREIGPTGGFAFEKAFKLVECARVVGSTNQFLRLLHGSKH